MTESSATARESAARLIGRSSRRALIAGALGGFGAWAAGVIGRAAPAAAEGENVQVGGEYTTATSMTLLRNQTNGNAVFSAQSWSTGLAVYGKSDSGTGVYGDSYSGNGLVGVSTTESAINAVSGSLTQPAVLVLSTNHRTGLLGASGALAPATVAKTGVHGYAVEDSSSRGVIGQTLSGQGVRGQATSGVGLFGTAGGGYAIRGDGRVRFDKVSGVATIAAGSTSKTVNPGVNVTSASFVLLTPKANLGGRALWFTTNPTTNRFTIRMSAARGSSTRIAWLLLG